MNPFEGAADNIAEIYAVNQLAVHGLITTTIHTQDFTTKPVRDAALSELRRIYKTFADFASRSFEGESRRISRSMFPNMPQSVKQQHMTLLTEHVQQATDAFNTEVKALLARDFGYAQKTFRKAALTVDLMMLTQRLGLDHALMSVRVDQSLQAPMHRDRANRKTLGQNFLRTLARQHFVLLKADMSLAKVAFEGGTQFQVVGSTDYEGQRFTIGEYDAIREAVFHPNSTATLEPA